jgi:anaerobic dimethyl sulfoxide reductase subunit B (iron-sulfur subunit)
MRVESPHGWCRFQAEYFEGIAPDVLMTKRGWWQACEVLNLPGYSVFDGGSEVNNLYDSDPAHFDKFYSQMAKQTLVKIRRLEDTDQRPGRTDASFLPKTSSSELTASNCKYTFHFDSERCLKCWACEIACRQWKGIPAGGPKLRKVIEVSSGVFPKISRQFISLTCRHCVDAPCVAACPQKAIIQRTEDGIVIVDRKKCSGCRICLEACPFEVPQFDAESLMYKCDMCLDRLEKGQKPICAATCPTGALRWGTQEEMSELAARKSADKLK